MQKITPFLWFDGNAEEAMNFYVSVFQGLKGRGASRGSMARQARERRRGAVMSATFQLEGQEFFALNGGPQFTFSPAISFFVNCETQQEVDELWEKLSAGGQSNQCGWLQGQVRPVVADRSLDSGQAAGGQGSERNRSGS